MKVKDKDLNVLVEVSQADCLTRGCYWPRKNPGAFEQGRGYRSYGDARDNEWLCGRREIHGCPPRDKRESNE